MHQKRTLKLRWIKRVRLSRISKRTEETSRSRQRGLPVKKENFIRVSNVTRSKLNQMWETWSKKGKIIVDQRWLNKFPNPYLYAVFHRLMNCSLLWAVWVQRLRAFQKSTNVATRTKVNIWWFFARLESDHLPTTNLGISPQTNFLLPELIRG